MQLDLRSLLNIRVLIIVMFYLDFQVLVSLVTRLDCSSDYVLNLLLQQYMHCSIVSHLIQKL